jgi:hypothetical protein
MEEGYRNNQPSRKTQKARGGKTMPTIKRVKGGFEIKHTTREVWGVDDPSEGHTLVVTSLHDATAHCSCGRWRYAFTGERTRREIEEEHERHIAHN